MRGVARSRVEPASDGMRDKYASSFGEIVRKNGKTLWGVVMGDTG